MATDTNNMPNYDADAEMFQNLSGAASQENPYMPFLQPKVVDRDGKRFLRIPKNQQLQKLAEFFDTAQKTKFNTANDFAKTYLDFLDRGTGGREDQKIAISASKKSGTGNVLPNGTKNRALNQAELERYGLPNGATLADIWGKPVPVKGTKNYTDFLTEANLNVGNMSRDPRQVYLDYQEAQQSIDADPTQYNKIRSDSRAAPFAHLLKPKKANDLFDMFSSLLGGMSVDTVDTTE